MPEEIDKPAPHGDPLKDVIDSNPEENKAQRDSDAPPDAVAERGDLDRVDLTNRAASRGSDANGIPASDEADGERRKKLYEDGAELVSRID